VRVWPVEREQFAQAPLAQKPNQILLGPRLVELSLPAAVAPSQCALSYRVSPRVVTWLVEATHPSASGHTHPSIPASLPLRLDVARLFTGRLSGLSLVSSRAAWGTSAASRPLMPARLPRGAHSDSLRSLRSPGALAVSHSLRLDCALRSQNASLASRPRSDPQPCHICSDSKNDEMLRKALTDSPNPTDVPRLDHRCSPCVDQLST